MPTMPSPRRARLADGREILYFDDPGSSRGEPRPDPRDLPPRSEPAELRHDRLTDSPLIIAAVRQDRTFLPPAADCPLCPSRDDIATEIPEPDYDVVAFENRFPSLPAVPEGASDAAAGRAEVVCYTADHAASFAFLPAPRLATIGAAWAHRTHELSTRQGVAQVLVFENRGEAIGVTLHHPHGQVYAYPFVPPRLARMADVAVRHREERGTCLGCDLLAEEVAEGRRIVAADEHGVAYVPRAARWPFEVHLVPRRHVPDLAALTDDERTALVMLQADVLARLDRLFDGTTPYMAGWLQAPIGAEREIVHLRLEIATPQRAPDRLKFLAGSESLAGAWINDVRPEEAARRLLDTQGR
jgi:UDPglucose--hexose-1-phosphate uridylyltransferase